MTEDSVGEGIAIAVGAVRAAADGDYDRLADILSDGTDVAVGWATACLAVLLHDTTKRLLDDDEERARQLLLALATEVETGVAPTVQADVIINRAMRGDLDGR